VDGVQDDGITSISWSPKANYFVATSWNSQIRCWQADMSGQSIGRGETKQEGPVLCSAWKGDGTQVFTGGCDNKALCWDVGSGTTVLCAQHAAPIRQIAYSDHLNCLITASWDKTVKFWDARKSNPLVHSLQLSERVYCMDIKNRLMVVGVAQKDLYVYDLQNPQRELKHYTSPLKYQSRCVACFPNATGFALGSVEGRVAIQDINTPSKSFEFKCHRQGNNIFAVNSISFHPGYGTLATAGADGSFHFWDKDSRQRLKGFQKMHTSISCSSFNGDGSLYAYAASYDWSKGHAFYQSMKQNVICIHRATDSEIRDRPRPR